ncbi:Crp/Fnr family transcriptional regulator, partial [Acidovorax sp.]|uniref:Crp/Fnr family transcriptional regulator n=1 Tax=Acidovorax sp. TaxID=1872122 RepID=UPI0025C2803D
MLSTLPPAPRFISAQPWFASVPAALQERLREEVFAVQGDKGAVMMPAGSAVEGWHAVLSGLVMLQSPASKGRASAFIGVPDGEWFGEGSAMKPEPRKYNVVALRPTTLLCLPLPLFATLRESSLAFNQFLVQHLNMRLGQAMTIIEAGRTQSPEHRVALYLSRLFWRSTRRLNLTQDELGQLVGLSRQTVNRGLGQRGGLGMVGGGFLDVGIGGDEAARAYHWST